MVTVLRSPRVFISHVNGDPSGEGIWPTLCDRLAAARFDVLVDRALLRAGDLWRAEIYGWIGLCDAAVILISRQALDDPSKHWVARETACLICRRYHEPSLKIIPVLLDGITFEDLEATERFRDLQLAESQCVRGANVEAVAAGLQNLQPAADTPLTKLAYQIRGVLADFNPLKIETVLRFCDVDLGTLTSQLDPHLQLALSMLTMDVDTLPEILGLLIGLIQGGDKASSVSRICCSPAGWKSKPCAAC